MFVLNCNFELGVLDECIAIAVTNSMCTDLPVVHYFPYFVDQCTLRSAFCDYFMSTVFSFDVLLKWARRNDAVCIFESTKIPEIGGRGRRVVEPQGQQLQDRLSVLFKLTHPAPLSQNGAG